MCILIAVSVIISRHAEANAGPGIGKLHGCLVIVNVPYSTACTPMDLEEVELSHRVKVIRDSKGYALYFSRGILPSNKSGKASKFPPPFLQQPYLLHLGIACFDRKFLQTYCQLPPTPCMVGSGHSANCTS